MPEYRMGDLADETSYDPNAIDWSRMNQPFGTLTDTNPVQYRTPTGVEIRPSDINQAIDVGMGFSGGGLSTKPIKAYHSSPHDFDKFDLSKIGTGEGAQVYGHGLYFAENPAVSGQGGQYWNQFMRHPSLSEGQQHAGSRLAAEGFDKERAIAATQRDINDWRDILNNPELSGTARSFTDKTHPERMLALRQAELDALVNGKAGPRTYEVNINADPAHFLDWDKTVPTGHALRGMIADKALANTGSVYADVRNAGKDAFLSAQSPQLTGEGAYRSLVRASLDKPRGEAVPYVSSMLNEAGIPGIKYLDQGSRPPPARFGALFPDPSPTPTSNYVVFNPTIVDIMRKYGIAAPIGGMGALAAQDDYR